MDAFVGTASQAAAPTLVAVARRQASSGIDVLVPEHLRPLINGVSVARVLHGVYSPVFGAADFRPYNPEGGKRRLWGSSGRDGLWGRYAGYDFAHVAEVAARVLRAP